MPFEQLPTAGGGVLLPSGSVEAYLPIGETTRVDVIERRQDGDWYITHYLGVGPLGTVGMFQFTCGGPTGSDDQWLSIAKTIERLPAEE